MAEKRKPITGDDAAAAAPSSNKIAYLKLPENVGIFKPSYEKGKGKSKSYRAIFLPWIAGATNPATRKGNWATNRFIKVHQRLGPNVEHHLCPAGCFGKKCPVCEQCSRLRGRKMESQEWETTIKPLFAKDRELFLIHLLDQHDDPENILVWDESIMLFGEAFRAMYKKREKWRMFADPDEGSVVEFECVEKAIGQNSCADCTRGIIIEPREKKLPKFLLKAMDDLCLDDWVIETPYSRLARLIGSASEEDVEEQDKELLDDEDDDDEEAPPRSRKGTTRREPPEDLEDLLDDDEEEAPPPPKKGKGKAKVEEPEDEPEEDDDDDEPEPEPEPEPKPAPRRPGKPRR